MLLIDLGECSTSSASSTSNESSTTEEVPSGIIGGSNDSEMPDALSILTDSLLGEFDSTITFVSLQLKQIQGE